MIITIPWLKEHLKTKANESEIIDKLTNIGLEVEGIKEAESELSAFKIAKIVKALTIFAILNALNSLSASLIPSTSNPMFVSLSIISLSFALVLRCSLSHGIVIIICLNLYN